MVQDFGVLEALVVAVVLLLIVGPERILPRARAAGDWFSTLRPPAIDKAKEADEPLTWPEAGAYATAATALGFAAWWWLRA